MKPADLKKLQSEYREVPAWIASSNMTLGEARIVLDLRERAFPGSTK